MYDLAEVRVYGYESSPEDISLKESLYRLDFF